MTTAPTGRQVVGPRRRRVVRRAPGAGDAATGCVRRRLRRAGVLSGHRGCPLRRSIHGLTAFARVRWAACGVLVQSVRPAVPVTRVVVSGLRPGRISWGTADVIPRRAVLGAASGEAGQCFALAGWRDRIGTPAAFGWQGAWQVKRAKASPDGSLSSAWRLFSADGGAGDPLKVADD